MIKVYQKNHKLVKKTKLSNELKRSRERGYNLLNQMNNNLLILWGNFTSA